MSALLNQLSRSVLLFDDVVAAIFADNVTPL